jgi:hypothetical protein
VPGGALNLSSRGWVGSEKGVDLIRRAAALAAEPAITAKAA